MSISPSNDQVRVIILDFLHKELQEHPRDVTNKENIVQALGVPQKQLDFNMFYLQEKGLVELITAMDGWHCANITAYGIDVIENKDSYKSEFPFINNTTIQVQGNNYGAIIQANNHSTIIFHQQISDAFKEAYEKIEKEQSLAPELKEQIKVKTKALEEELNKAEPDAGIIQQSWKWIKQNANWLIPTLTQVVTEGIKIACGV